MASKLYVGNLAFQTTEAEVQEAFSRSGTVAEVKLILDRDSGRSRGFAFVTMGSDQEADRAIEELNGSVLDGRPLRVNVADDKPSGPRRDGGGGNGGGRRDGGYGRARW